MIYDKHLLRSFYLEDAKLNARIPQKNVVSFL